MVLCSHCQHICSRCQRHCSIRTSHDPNGPGMQGAPGAPTGHGGGYGRPAPVRKVMWTCNMAHVFLVDAFRTCASCAACMSSLWCLEAESDNSCMRGGSTYGSSSKCDSLLLSPRGRRHSGAFRTGHRGC
jgi:hypothetical protein